MSPRLGPRGNSGSRLRRRPFLLCARIIITWDAVARKTHFALEPAGQSTEYSLSNLEWSWVLRVSRGLASLRIEISEQLPSRHGPIVVRIGGTWRPCSRK